MKIQHSIQEQVAVVTLDGDVTHEQAESLRSVCRQCLSSRARDIVLDMSKVLYVDSAGLEAMLDIQDQVAEVLGQMRLVGLCENLRTILRMTRLDVTFQSHEDMQTALESLKV
mgnify:CR=1 FL=1